jgi:hypothetical protein
MRPGGAGRWVVLALVPLLLAAADPPGDVAGCRGGAGSGAPDLLEAEGEIVELGTSARWTLTFAEPLAVPDAEGRPFRVDVALLDPDVPALTFGHYRRVNRLVRVDATIEHPTQILLLPEGGTNVFNPPVVEGATMTIQVPGRTLSDDEDLTGTSPGLERFRWTVIVRDEGACDRLGDGRPTHRLAALPEASPSASPGPAEPDPAEPDPAGGPTWWLLVAAGLAIGAVVAYGARRRASS